MRLKEEEIVAMKANARLRIEERLRRMSIGMDLAGTRVALHGFQHFATWYPSMVEFVMNPDNEV